MVEFLWLKGVGVSLSGGVPLAQGCLKSQLGSAHGSYVLITYSIFSLGNNVQLKKKFFSFNYFFLMDMK